MKFNIDPKKRAERIEKFIPILEPLGFSCAHMESFTHTLVGGDERFDFSALDDDWVVCKAIQWIYEKGIEQGKADKIEEIHQVLSIPKQRVPVSEVFFA